MTLILFFLLPVQKQRSFFVKISVIFLVYLKLSFDTRGLGMANLAFMA